MLRPIYRYWRLVVVLLAMWMVQNFLPSALQGASTEIGQNIYGFLTQFNAVLDGIDFIRSLGERFGGK